jgi:hypothetical protein
MNENQSSTSKSYTNNTPFRRNQNEKRKKNNTQREKQTSHPKAKAEEQMTLTEIKTRRSVGL